MSEEGKESGNEDQSEVTRRQFFIKVGLTSIAVAGAGTAVFSYQFLTPNVLYEPSPIVNEGAPDRYPPNSVTLDPAAAIFIIHGAQGFYALSAICTHLGCLTAYKPTPGIIACPCHGSKFNKQGVKIAGPAPRPLPWLHMWLNDDGQLMVDRSIVNTAKELVRV